MKIKKTEKMNKKDFKHIEIYENQDAKGCLIGFQYEGLGFNFLNIDIDIEIKKSVDVQEINGRRHYLHETDYSVIINENDFIISKCEIFDADDGFTEKDYTLSDEETKLLMEAIEDEILNNIENYIDND